MSTSWHYDLLLPDAAIEGMQATVKRLDEVTPKIDQHMQQAAQEIGQRVNKALDEYQGQPPIRGVTDKPTKAKADELEPPKGNELPGTVNSQSVSEQIKRLDMEGHAPARHGGPNRVTKKQLVDRALRGKDPASGTIYDAYRKNPDGSPALHRVGKNASAFSSDEALVRADSFVRNSEAFKHTLAIAQAKNKRIMSAVEVSLEDVFGENYRDFVRGVSRLGSKKNPIGYELIDFSQGKVKAIYLRNGNNVTLHTLYPEPKKISELE
ncbi:hypothetical protein [Pseudoalteromonas sp. JC28]|uniref:hypothetical protein n=1 Tax=Pseudoalteromonas sp. JC28 TaxID=2267617 RepID=UPI0020C5FDDF|nr:hypothetical protein [Pseudoalteromonas sp. JC28]